MVFKICTWFDTVTPESAAEGDYESTGNGWRENATDCIYEAAKWHAEALLDLGHFEINENNGIPDYADSVAYAVDSEINCNTGAEDSYRVAVTMPKMKNSTKYRKLHGIYNRLVVRALTRIGA